MYGALNHLGRMNVILHTFPHDSATATTNNLFTKILNLITLNYQTLRLNNIDLIIHNSLK